MKTELFLFKFSAMGGDNELQIYAQSKYQAEKAANAAINEVRRIEQKFSRYLPDSIVSQINAAAGTIPVAVDAETAGLLDYAEACFRQSDGLFDVTSGVLRRVWNFREKHLPSASEIASLLGLIGWQKVSWVKPYVLLSRPGMEIDFGGIGKEYAVDRACEVLLQHGTPHSLVNLAGDLRACAPQYDGSPWRVGISDPQHSGQVLTVTQILSGAVATSGDYERQIEIEGKRYSHLLNPKTGWPVEGFQSVTVLAKSCLIAGSITTTAMLLGKRGRQYLNELGVPYIAVTSEGRTYFSGLLKRSSSTQATSTENLLEQTFNMQQRPAEALDIVRQTA